MKKSFITLAPGFLMTCLITPDMRVYQIKIFIGTALASKSNKVGTYRSAWPRSS